MIRRLRKWIVLAMPACLWTSASAQLQDTTMQRELPPVTVTAFQEEPFNRTAVHVTALYPDSLRGLGNYNLTDLLQEIPGVSGLTSGIGITKPVIRGLFGNRILVLQSGLKFDNQQWQEEHGLGLSDLGLERVELIKGPMSVLYGTEAMGGVINLIEEGRPAPGARETDIGVRLYSNTTGGLLQAGHAVQTDNHWYRVRAGIENNADYSDGNTDRVLNSRFDGYYLKASYGFKKKNWISTTNYAGSFNRFGFIFNDVYTFIEADGRQSRDLSNFPTHLVLLNILSSKNTFLLKNHSVLTLNAGVQSNERLENEGGGAISLNMHLLTLQYLLKWEKQITGSSALVLSNLGVFEDNTNFGSRKIVPDATMQESNLAAYLETVLRDKLVFENGVSVGEKHVRTFFTPSINGPDKEQEPFSKLEFYYNLFTGLSWNPGDAATIKYNISTGVRIPNLAELSSDGLHEGVFTYEIGDPDLENEQLFSMNLDAAYHQGALRASVSPFYNRFLNYVYLAPTNEEWFGFPVYRYRQQNAEQYGFEAEIDVALPHEIHVGSGYAGMVSKTDDGNYTPFIPAKKLTPFLQVPFHLAHETFRFRTDVDYCFMQDKVYPDEIATGSYTLLNAALSTELQRKDADYTISLSGKNLLNEAYTDHLSRYKYFGLLNPGRNIVLAVHMTFHKSGEHG